MKSILLLLSISILFNIQTNAQRERQGTGRGQESGRIERIDRIQDRERPTNNPQRKNKRDHINNPRRPPKKHYSNPIVVETESYCPEKTAVCGGTVDNFYYQPSNEELAIQFFESGDLGSALLHIELAIKSDLFNPSLYFLRGKVFFELNDYIQAKRDFTTVIVFEPEKAEPYYYRGMCYLNLGSQHLAMKDFEIAASLGDMTAENLLVRYNH